MPFRKGFSLGPEYRFGEIVSGLEELLAKLHVGLVHPDIYWSEKGGRHAAIKREIYGGYADGRATVRCVGRLLSLIE
jgi:CDP-glycerol glycerophosphotransferase